MVSPSGVPSALSNGDLRKHMWHVDTWDTNLLLLRLRYKNRHTLKQSSQGSRVICIVTKITRRSINADFTRG